MPDRRNPFEGVTDFVSELSRLRSLGVHGALETSGDNPSARMPPRGCPAPTSSPGATTW